MRVNTWSGDKLYAKYYRSQGVTFLSIISTGPLYSHIYMCGDGMNILFVCKEEMVASPYLSMKNIDKNIEKY